MRAPGEPPGAVGGPAGAKIGAQGSPNKKFAKFRVPPKARKSTKRASSSPQEHPKRAQESPKTPSSASLDPKPGFFEYRAPSEAKSRFLRVGGSAWELKIDTKRLEDKENNDFEEGSQRRYEKTSI